MTICWVKYICRFSEYVVAKQKANQSLLCLDKILCDDKRQKLIHLGNLGKEDPGKDKK